MIPGMAAGTQRCMQRSVAAATSSGAGRGPRWSAPGMIICGGGEGRGGVDEAAGARASQNAWLAPACPASQPHGRLRRHTSHPTQLLPGWLVR